MRSQGPSRLLQPGQLHQQRLVLGRERDLAPSGVRGAWGGGQPPEIGGVLFAVALTVWRVEESKSPHPAPPDWAGFALLTTGLVSLIYGLIRAGENSWSDTGVIIFDRTGRGEPQAAPAVPGGVAGTDSASPARSA